MSEIEELRHWLTKDLTTRDAIIEECARVAESLQEPYVADAIRALKDK